MRWFCPDLDRVTIKKYYKIPIVYAALGGVGYAIVLIPRITAYGVTITALSPDEPMKSYLRYWRRNMELSYIGLILVYALQVVDAYVDAQL